MKEVQGGHPTHKQLAFYRQENHRWKQAVGRRLCLTLPIIAFTLFAAYKKNPILTLEGACVSMYGLYSTQKANFYRRRSAYRLHQQKKSLELN